MTKRTLVVFTYRPKHTILAERGSQAWALNPRNARRCTHIICTRNRYSVHASPEEQSAAQEEHGAAFMVGKITAVEPSPERPDRYIVRFDEYADLDPQPIVWSGARNPVWYPDNMEQLGIDLDMLTWSMIPGQPDDEDDATDAHFDKCAGPLGHVILEFNNLEVDVGRMIARLLGQDDVTAAIFTGAIPFMDKVRLIQMLVATKVQDPPMRREFDAIVRDATDLNAKRNRYVHSEYLQVVGPNDDLEKVLHRRLKDGAKSANRTTGQSVQNLFQPVHERHLKSLAADIHRLAFRVRALAEKHYDRRFMISD